jgi:hypothetical protein
MPISEYFGGHGSEVMKELKAKHGEKEGERIFYATAAKEGQKPAEDAAVAGRTSRTARDSFSRRSRLHAALDRVMDRCGYGKDNANPNVIKEIEKHFAYGRPTGHRFTEAELAEMRRSAESKNAKPAGHELQAKDSAYRLTARDEGLLRSILEGATSLARGGLGAMTPTQDRK